MDKISVLLTCHNRKDKTIKCLKTLKAAIQKSNLTVEIYLTDDGSTDGTGVLVKELFPEVVILKGNGSLFWAGGMRNSWNEALKNNDFDAYLLLNDDTSVSIDLFEEMIYAHQQTIRTYGIEGIYVGSTQESGTGAISYGGSVIINKFYYKTKRLEPNGTIQLCDLGNANIMFVPKEVVNKIGTLSDEYVHGAADYDYTLRARKRKIPVVVMPNYCGECCNDHPYVYENFSRLSLINRIKRLYKPTGLAYRDRLRYMKNNFPYRFPFVVALGWLQILFPRIFVSSTRGR